ncbi:flagellar hook-basal body complex protein FliE [Frigidibacter sp. MR17.24]|uniref:flagellar hook-basal body complex protein FliE n=1 Tax=Frigidibacter sp. MR17.24 TaxID=3127345 RepID=UPI0030130634
MVEITNTSIIASSAARAYRGGQAMGGSEELLPLVAPAESQPQSFADVLRETAEQAVRTVQEGDVAARAGMVGAMPTQQVVEATMALESTVRTTVAVRDRLVEAYQEIMRMQI